jgi:HlyD family secretion protein
MMAKRSRTRWAAAILLFLVAGTMLLTRVGKKPPPLDPASLVAAATGEIVRSVVATGVVEPISNQVEIRSKASGMVKNLRVDVGDEVAPGQVLLELDQDHLLAQLREAEANLQAAKADQRAAAAELARSRILADDRELALARLQLTRAEQMHAQKLISDFDLETARGKVDDAEKRQQAATAAIGVTEAAVDQKQAKLAQVQAILDRIREELGFATIRSPIHGVVLSRNVEVGSAVSSITTMGAGATSIVVLGDARSVYVKGRLAESDVGVVRVGLPARTRVEAFKDKVFLGKVYRISPLGEPKDGVTFFEVRVSVENPQGLLRANMTANAEIVLEEHTNALIVPLGAVLFDSSKEPYVEMPDASSATGRRRVAIKTGLSTGTSVEVHAGLKAGDRVILQ